MPTSYSGHNQKERRGGYLEPRNFRVDSLQTCEACDVTLFILKVCQPFLSSPTYVTSPHYPDIYKATEGVGIRLKGLPKQRAELCWLIPNHLKLLTGDKKEN